MERLISSLCVLYNMVFHIILLYISDILISKYIETIKEKNKYYKKGLDLIPLLIYVFNMYTISLINPETTSAIIQIYKENIINIFNIIRSLYNVIINNIIIQYNKIQKIYNCIR